jgi:hypothetical protein
MNITKNDLQWATEQGVLSADQATTLWRVLSERAGQRARFDLPHVAYYTGALIVIGAMTWFMTLAWDAWGGGALLAVAAAYAAVFGSVGWLMWTRSSYKVAAGMLITIAVCMTPLAIYGIEELTGLWPQGDPGSYHDYYLWVKGSWIVMEVGTVLAALLALRWVRFPFLTAPIAFSLWFLSMDLTPLVFGQLDYTWEQQLWVSLVVGLVMIVAAYMVDQRTPEDYAFWGYLFGTVAFWGGLSLMEGGGEAMWFVYCLINVLLMLVAVFLDRRVFMVFGALGVFGYLGHLAYDLFESSVLFPFALTGLGLLVIALGVLYQRHRVRIERTVLHALPLPLQQLRPMQR